MSYFTKNEQIFVELSHIIEDGLVTYKGLPAPVICDFWSHEDSRSFYEDGTEFQIGKIEMVANTGTYLDAPFHRYRDGKDLSELSLERLASLEGSLINAKDQTEIGVSFFENRDLRGKAILVYTDWAKHWRTEAYFEKHPYLTKAAAEYLAAQKVVLVGIDSHNIDDTAGKSRPVHTILLGEEILIVEHLCNLGQLIGKSFRFTATPPKIKGMGTFPVRAFAEIME